MENKNLLKKLQQASEIISKNRTPKATYINLSYNFIKQQADESDVSFDKMVEIIKSELSGEMLTITRIFR